jgi:hypothetical protein
MYIYHEVSSTITVEVYIYICAMYIYHVVSLAITVEVYICIYIMR